MSAFHKLLFHSPHPSCTDLWSSTTTDSAYSYKPDQQTAEWRVNTAGNLLLDLEVTQDMRVIFSDATPQVLDHTRKKRDGILPFLPNQKAADALILASKEKVPIVNIDSEQVKLVSDLRRHSGEFDLESTLIEVDATSMMNLLVNFRLIIQNRNASQDLDETRNLLESMMEDVRRLCNRSAILFRMSTRTKIITSKDIRYGFSKYSSMGLFCIYTVLYL